MEKNRFVDKAWKFEKYKICKNIFLMCLPEKLVNRN